MTARRFYISGMVQGVGYRYFAQRAAATHQVHGYVKNLADGRVEAFAQGSERQVNEFRDDLATGPRFSKVDEIEEIVEEFDPRFSTFRIEQ
jgi:acylphosphatase